MYHDTNVAAWMIAGGNRNDEAAERARTHLRDLKASRPATPSLRERLGTALAARRRAAVGTTLAAAGAGTTRLDAAACCAA